MKKEILGNGLKLFFEKFEANMTYKGEKYEIWELEEDEFNKIRNMTEDEFVRACPNGWWRSANGSNMNAPIGEITINDTKINAWDSRDYKGFEEDIREICEDNEELDLEKVDAFVKEELNSYRNEMKYDNLSEYLHKYIGVSQPRNICSLCVDLAKINKITMGELFKTYEGNYRKS